MSQHTFTIASDEAVQDEIFTAETKLKVSDCLERMEKAKSPRKQEEVAKDLAAYTAAHLDKLGSVYRLLDECVVDSEGAHTARRQQKLASTLKVISTKMLPSCIEKTGIASPKDLIPYMVYGSTESTYREQYRRALTGVFRVVEKGRDDEIVDFMYDMLSFSMQTEEPAICEFCTDTIFSRNNILKPDSRTRKTLACAAYAKTDTALQQGYEIAHFMQTMASRFYGPGAHSLGNASTRTAVRKFLDTMPAEFLERTEYLETYYEIASSVARARSNGSGRHWQMPTEFADKWPYYVFLNTGTLKQNVDAYLAMEYGDENSKSLTVYIPGSGPRTFSSVKGAYFVRTNARKEVIQALTSTEAVISNGFALKSTLEITCPDFPTSRETHDAEVQKLADRNEALRKDLVLRPTRGLSFRGIDVEVIKPELQQVGVTHILFEKNSKNTAEIFVTVQLGKSTMQLLLNSEGRLATEDGKPLFKKPLQVKMLPFLWWETAIVDQAHELICGDEDAFVTSIKDANPGASSKEIRTKYVARIGYRRELAPGHNYGLAQVAKAKEESGWDLIAMNLARQEEGLSAVTYVSQVEGDPTLAASMPPLKFKSKRDKVY